MQEKTSVSILETYRKIGQGLKKAYEEVIVSRTFECLNINNF